MLSYDQGGEGRCAHYILECVARGSILRGIRTNSYVFDGTFFGATLYVSLLFRGSVYLKVSNYFRELIILGSAQYIHYLSWVLVLQIWCNNSKSCIFIGLFIKNSQWGFSIEIYVCKPKSESILHSYLYCTIKKVYVISYLIWVLYFNWKST